MPFKGRLAAAVIAAASLTATPTLASGGLSVSPISLNFTADRRSNVLEVANPGDEPVQVQLRLFAWSGGGVEDTYAVSGDIGFSPPMFQLAPGARQTVRLMASPQTPAAEKSYRLFVDQLVSTEKGGVSMPVRMALPLFVAPVSAAPPALVWRVERDAKDHAILLIARNEGGRRLRLSGLSYETGGKITPIAPGLSGYVLAGQEHAWRLQPPPAKAMNIQADTDLGPLRAVVALN